MRLLTERVYFLLCLVLGRLLRAGRYAQVRVVLRGGALQVHKSRCCYAPLLIWLGGPLFKILDTGVRVLPQREWVERERRIYRDLHGLTIRSDATGRLILPYLARETLAALLDGPALAESVRKRAIARAVVALADFHRRGFTHGDAMAENVLVDLDANRAHWFDFETLHDPRRPLVWRHADDLRALLATCLVRTAPERHAATLDLILDIYADEEVTRELAANFGAILRRPLTFHLAQAGLSGRSFRAIGRLLEARLGE